MRKYSWLQFTTFAGLGGFFPAFLLVNWISLPIEFSTIYIYKGTSEMYLHFALKGPEILGRPVVKKCCVIKRIYMDFPSGFFHIKTFLKLTHLPTSSTRSPTGHGNHHQVMIQTSVLPITWLLNYSGSDCKHRDGVTEGEKWRLVPLRHTGWRYLTTGDLADSRRDGVLDLQDASIVLVYYMIFSHMFNRPF